MSNARCERIVPGSFEPEHHYYPRVLNAHRHPLVRFFLSLSNDQLAERYIHLHPEADRDRVHSLLAHRPTHFRWAGADVFHVATDRGVRRNVVIETNSSPSGQKSMPYDDEEMGMGGYRELMERTFLPMTRRRGLPAGELAVICDKNPMETRAYAAVLAELSGEPVWWVHWPQGEENIAFVDSRGVLNLRTDNGQVPIRAAFKYLTQRPWNRLPPLTRTVVLNPVLVCLAGGRNKLMASKAYDLMNADLDGTGIRLRTPETIWDVAKQEVPLWVERMGGVAVVKVPYANAGQGVYTITSKSELDAFMAMEHRYDLFIVQSLIGNAAWSSRTREGTLYHVGTIPNKKGEIFAADLRFMVGADPSGFYPLAIYARRARKPLAPTLESGVSSWDMLGTNLSKQNEDGSWTTEPERLLLMDSRDFNRLGIGLDDLTEAYIQTVLSVTAIDEMAKRLTTKKGLFRRKFFGTLNSDAGLLREICRIPGEKGGTHATS